MPIERSHDPRAFQISSQEQRGEASDSLLPGDDLDPGQYGHQAEAERRATLHAIREGLADVEAGRTRPARDALAELRRKHRPQRPR